MPWSFEPVATLARNYVDQAYICFMWIGMRQIFSKDSAEIYRSTVYNTHPGLFHEQIEILFAHKVAPALGAQLYKCEVEPSECLSKFALETEEPERILLARKMGSIV
jgi:hypothetical protein